MSLNVFEPMEVILKAYDATKREISVHEAVYHVNYGSERPLNIAEH